MLKVLIVDDSFFMRAALRLQRKALGCEVVGEAADREQAMERYRALHPDLVTMDVVLDADSGILVAEKICQEDPEAKILMISAVGQTKVLEDARKAGASGYVLKPVELPPLKEAIEKITGEVLQLSPPLYSGLTQERLDRMLARGLEMAGEFLIQTGGTKSERGDKRI